MTITCPSCGKELTVTDPDRKFIFCRHCGTKIEVAAFVHAPQQTVPAIESSADTSLSDAKSSTAALEELRAQHALELERLRHEHELELERLRHENEMELERMKLSLPQEAESEDEDESEDEEEYEEYVSRVIASSQEKSLSWKAGHFFRKHPFWTIIIVYVIFAMLFGGSSSSSTSSSRSSTSVSYSSSDSSSQVNTSSSH